MAVTGLIGIGFVIGHMAGNLQVFKGAGAAQAMHDYAVFLRKTRRTPLPRARRARRRRAPARHGGVAAVGRATARRARWTTEARGAGLHARLAHHARGWRAAPGVHRLPHPDFTFGIGVPGFQHLDPYHNLRNGVHRAGGWCSSTSLAMVVLGFHLYHGAWAFAAHAWGPSPAPSPLHRNIAWRSP